MNVLIIEDEDLAARRLTKLLAEEDTSIQVVQTTPTVEMAVSYLETEPAIDLIFMDIELADGQSFEIFEQTVVSAPVIFTTSYDEYAIKAFKVNSVDYLLKPIKQHELAASLQKYRRLNRVTEPLPAPALSIDALVQQLRQQKTTTEYRRRLLVRHLSQWVPIDVQEIAYFQSEDVTLFRTITGKKFSADYTLDELEATLDPTLFFRVNRRFLVNINAVQQIQTYFNHRLVLTLTPAPTEEVIISRERVAEFKKWMGK